VDTKREIQEFVTSRRGRITPEQAGVRTFGSGPRRVPGLRREEVASLAGVSIAYYTKLERGDASGASDTVLEALSRALQLDDAERAHLFDLVRAQQPVSRTRRAPARHRRSGPACSGSSTGSTRRHTSATAAWTSSR
jgi:transcriptional regulator with XRE-family HTH domain